MTDEQPIEPTDDERFAASVKRLRELKGWSQGELARRMSDERFEGFHQTTISRIEKNERPVKIGEAHGFARVFETMIGAMIAPGGVWEVVDSAQREFQQVTRELARLHDSAYHFHVMKRTLKEALLEIEQLGPTDQLEPDLAKWIERLKVRSNHYFSQSSEDVARMAVEHLEDPGVPDHEE